MNPEPQPALEEIIQRRLSRRQALAAGLPQSAHAGESSSLQFQEVRHGYDDEMAWPPEYDAQALLRWGDPIVAGAPPFDLHRQTVAAQEKQAGYNKLEFTLQRVLLTIARHLPCWARSSLKAELQLAN